MALRDTLFGTPSRIEQQPLLSGQQQSVQNQILGMLPQITQMGNFQPIADAAQQRFQQQTMPTIQERFAGQGRSSGRSQALANAQRDLQTQLAGQESQFNLGQQRNLASLLGYGFQPSYENIEIEGQEGIGGQWLSKLLQLAPHLIGGFASGGSTIPLSLAAMGVQNLPSQGVQGGVNYLSSLFGSGGV